MPKKIAQYEKAKMKIENRKRRAYEAADTDAIAAGAYRSVVEWIIIINTKTRRWSRTRTK